MNQIAEVPDSSVTCVEQLPEESREQMVLRIAESCYSTAADWTSFFRDILGPDGITRKVFTNVADLEAFVRSSEHSQIQHMLAKLRERKDVPSEESEPTKVITVRLPKVLHESLRKEAHACQTSMNKLCISKLLQIIENGLVPAD